MVTTVYRAKDGKIFDELADAEQHERDTKTVYAVFDALKLVRTTTVNEGQWNLLDDETLMQVADLLVMSDALARVINITGES